MCTAPTDTLRLQLQTATRLFGWQEHKPKVACTRKTAKEKIDVVRAGLVFFLKKFFFTLAAQPAKCSLAHAFRPKKPKVLCAEP